MTTAVCLHHWQIAPPNGPTSVGVCRKCKERRTFSNSEDDVLLASTQAHRQHAGEASKAKRGGAVSPAQRGRFYQAIASVEAWR